MKTLFGILAILTGLFVTSQVQAAVTFGSGTYTNLCGTGFAATSNTCNKGCNTSSGSCSATSNRVVRYVCDGRQNECRSNESAFFNYSTVTGIGCGKTVQIDVFTKTCRVNGNWTCGSNDLLDYMVYYTGDCAANPTATPHPTTTPKPTATPRPTTTPSPTSQTHNRSCDELSIVSGNDSYLPANVTLKARGSDNLGSIQKYRFYFGDGRMEETTNSEVTHRYESSGTFTAIANVQDSKGNWVGGNACQKVVTVKSIPVVNQIESHKSACSNVVINEGNQTKAPTTARFTVTGYDNKGSIKKYKIDFGDGTQEERSDNAFQKRYEKAGTYVIKGYVLDSQNNWKGGDGSCDVSLYVTTEAMTKQPNTGTPTTFTLLGLGSGLMSLLFFKFRQSLV